MSSRSSSNLSRASADQDASPRATSSYTGQPIRAYPLGEQIGNGRTCNVYRVLSSSGLLENNNLSDGALPSRGLVAKIYRTGPEDEPDDFLYDWKQEIKYLTRLASDYTPKIVDAPMLCWLENGSPRIHAAIIMEDAGESVSAMIKRGPIPESTARIIAGHTCRALAMMHPALTHGDVKPGNIFWDGTKAVLGDLAGMVDAKSTDEDEYASGTVSYWAPEFLYSDPRDPPIDIWALGTTYFHMVTGDHLFDVYQDTETRYGGGLDDLGIPMIIEDTDASSVEGHNRTTDELTHFRLSMLYHKILGPPPMDLVPVMSGFFTDAGEPHFGTSQEPVVLREFLGAWSTHTPVDTEIVLRSFLQWDPAARPTPGKARIMLEKLSKARQPKGIPRGKKPTPQVSPGKTNNTKANTSPEPRAAIHPKKK